MSEEVLNEKVMEGSENDKFELAMQEYQKYCELEERIKKIKDKVKLEKEKQANRRKRITKVKKKNENIVDVFKNIRSYTGVKREPDNIRRQFATQGFFDILNKFNDEDNDFSNAYNFIADTEWLLNAVMECIIESPYKKDITIDRKKLREKVFARKEEIEKIIADFEAELKIKLNIQDKKDDDKSADDNNGDENSKNEN